MVTQMMLVYGGGLEDFMIKFDMLLQQWATDGALIRRLGGM